MEQSIWKMEEELRQIRRELHQIPEIGLKEFKTALYVEEKLKAFGVPSVKRCLETGVLGFIEGENTQKTIAYRGDMDALPVTEEDKPYASCHPGFMHACGHDGHMSMLLGFAKYLMQRGKKPPVNVLLVFQPAEEGPGGAQGMIEAGVLKEYNVNCIIGCHIFPELRQGKVACRAGALMARNGEVRLHIRGESAHGAQPHLGADALLAAAAIITGVHTIVSRNISPIDSGVVSLCTIQGGEACNIIAKEVTIAGTIRAFSDAAYDTIVLRLGEIVPAIAAGFGCEAQAEFTHMYRVVHNDETMVETLKAICKTDYEETKPYMLAEDFSMFQQEIPGLFFFLGAKNLEKGFTAALHNAAFNFDEKILCQGVAIYGQLLEKLG